MPRPPLQLRRCAALLVSLAAVSSARAQRRDTLQYLDPRLPVGERTRDLLGRMTREEKFWQLFMIPGDLDDPAHDYSHGVFGLQIRFPESSATRPRAPSARDHAERINGIQRYFVEKTRLGIPIIPFEEAVHGLLAPGSTIFPQAIALAASWDTGLMARVATAIARETRSRGIRQVLSPVVNIASDVRWGRVEETYGEDPFLASSMGVAFVRPFERAGIITTPKHFVANVGEGGRDSYPIDLSERALEERFYPPFAGAINAGARSIMTAYNSVDGQPATQNRHLLTEKLRRDWRFSGFVISDAAATGGATVLHMTEPNTPTAAKDAWEAGLDVVFQSSWPQHRPYLDAIQRSLVSDSVIDAAVSRVLRAKFELGLFEHPYAGVDSAAAINRRDDHRSLAREAARASLVLLKNDGRVLPLSPRIGSVTVVGADAAEARLGGYTAPVTSRVSILDAIRERIGASRVRYAAGPGRTSATYVVVPAEQLATDSSGKRVQGLSASYFANNRLEGAPGLTRIDRRIDFGWTLNSPGRGIPFDWYSARWTGTLVATEGGVTRLGIEGNDGYRLWLDGQLLLDDWTKRSYGARLATVRLAPGTRHELKLEYFESTGNARLKLVWNAGVRNDWRRRIDSAVAIVRRSDVAVVVVGVEEGEFRDRASLALPGHQVELLQAVAATGKRTVVVIVAGSAVTMSPRLDQVGAVLDAWYPGEEGGHAVADALFGEYNPAGRLPVTFPMAEGQLPLYYNHKPTGRGDDYVDLTGQPLFPFGFGLSYTTFSYSALSIDPAEIPTTGRVVVRCVVKNTGLATGDEVVQLYVRDVLASVARPVMELKAFRRVHLAPNEEATVTFELARDDLRMLDRDMRWVVEPGVFRVMVGASSKDIRLRGELTVR